MMMSPRKPVCVLQHAVDLCSSNSNTPTHVKKELQMNNRFMMRELDLATGLLFKEKLSFKEKSERT